MTDIYDSKYDGYEREQCAICGQWVPWPALEDHACHRVEVPGPFGYAHDPNPDPTPRNR